MQTVRFIMIHVILVQIVLGHASYASSANLSIDPGMIEQKIQLMPLDKMTDQQIRQGLSEVEMLLVQLQDEISSAEAKNAREDQMRSRGVTLTVTGLSILAIVLGLRNRSTADATSLIPILLGAIGALFGAIGHVDSWLPDYSGMEMAKKYEVTLSREQAASLRSRVKVMQRRIEAIKTRLSPVNLPAL